MKETKTGKIRKIITTLMICIVIIMLFSISVLAASPYEVTKSGGALIRTSYAESAASVRRASQGSILWVQASKKNSAGNTWYQLTDGYWIYSGNVKKHSCTWSWVSGYNPTCTSNGVTNYRCNKCGQTKSVTSAAYGHKYESNVCKTCGAWNTSSLKSRSYLSNVKYYVTTNGAKVHSGPYGGCSTVTTLSKGTEIYVTEKIVNASNNTWYRYSGGYIFSDYVVLHSSCSWNSGTVTKKATCTSTGTKVQYCTICGKSKTTTLTKVSHKYDDNVCTVCGGWNTSSLKSKTAVNNIKYYVTTNGAKVHSGPYGGCSTVKILSRGAEIYVTEKIVNASKNTWYKYSDGYIFSDYVVAHNTCSWNSGTVTKKATCTSAGTKVQYCTICGKSKTTTLAKASHKYDDNVCTVCGGWNTSSLKSKSTVNNVKYCVVSQSAKVRSGPYEKCSAVKTLSKGTDIIVTEKVVNASGNTWYKYSGGYIFSEHVKKHSSCSWNSGTVTKKATCTSTGTKVQYCTICGKSKTTTLAKTSHKYDDNVCTVCGSWNTSSLKSKSAVNNVKYYVVKDGAKVHSGPYGGCKTVKTFTKGTEFTVTEKVVNASKNTWYKCSDGYVFSDYVKAHNTCSWNSGSVTKKATCKSTGTKVQKCKICGKSKTITLDKTSHKYEDNVCTACGAWNKSSLKSKSDVKNIKYYVVEDGAKVHSGPYSGCKTIKTLKKGTVITVTEKVVNASKNTWYKYADGYIYGKYVKDYALYTAKITLNAESSTLYVGQTKTLKATVKGPSSDVTWKSSDSAVASVDSKGRITGKKKGTCTITAKANGKKDTCKVTVKQLAAPKDIVVTTVEKESRFKISHKAVSGADGYEVLYYKKTKDAIQLPEKQAKTYTGKSCTVTVADEKMEMNTSDGYIYECSVRSYKLIDGKKYYSESSALYSVHAHIARSISTKIKYSSPGENGHTTTTTKSFTCLGCSKKVSYSIKNEEKHSPFCGVCQKCGYYKEEDGYALAKIYPTVSNGPSYSSKEKKNGKNPIHMYVKFDDTKFNTNKTSTFSEYLCKLSAVGAAVSYNEKFAVEFLKNCGFDEKSVVAKNSSSKASTTKADDNHHARYIIGHKKIENSTTTLVAILVNGYTSGGYEWISNFDVGESGYHKGFSRAADEVTEKINEYIEDQNINTKKIKIWITGHSRGAAVTGMVAVKLNKKYGIKNVLAYGFATPNGVPSDMAKKINSSNIFNIVNPGDFVPYVVPSCWDFTKLGSTIEISLDSKIKQYYKGLSGISYDGLSTAGRVQLITAFSLYAPNRTLYNMPLGDPTTGYIGVPPSWFGRAVGLAMSDAGINVEAASLIAACALEDVPSLAVLLDLVYNGKMTTNIHESHGMEIYLSMVYCKYS